MSNAAADLTIPQLMRDAVRAYSVGEALVFPDTRWSFEVLAAEASSLADALDTAGIGRGDHVGILMPDSADYAALLFGIWLRAAVAVPINGRYKSEELRHVVSHADLRLIVVDDDEAESFGYRRFISSVLQMGSEQTARDFPSLQGVCDLSGRAGASLRPLQRQRPGRDSGRPAATLADSIKPDDDAVLLYTSGTTSKPKGCVLTHNSIARHAANALGNALGVIPGDRLFVPLPLFHAGGIVMLLGCISLGTTLVHMGRFDAAAALKAMEREKCTVAYAPFEAMWGAILAHPDLATTNLATLRIAVYCAPTERVIQSQKTMPGTVIVSAYGSTESCTNLTMGRPDEPLATRMATVGRVVDGMEIKVVDAHDRERELQPGQQGELLFRGYSRFKNYYKDAELTRKLIDKDGWFASGDLASIDENGFLYFHGRLRDLLKVGGENVASIEIEGYLARHPDIEVVQVVGVPDSHYGEVPAAFIQLRNGAQVSERELQAFCIGKIASFKIPRYVRYVREWPMSGTKIKKFELRDQLTDELRRAGIQRAPRLQTRR